MRLAPVLVRVVLPAFLALPAGAAAQARPLVYQPNLTIQLARDHVQKASTIAVGPDGRVVVATEAWVGKLLAYDSTGKTAGWQTPTGHVRDAEIGWVGGMGWVGDSLWVADLMYDQIAIVGPDGRVVRTQEKPSWVRPAWRDRRKYPLFSSMTWLAVYGDGSMLVTPMKPRALFDTPQYDRSFTHVLRVDRDGRILRTVALVPAAEGRLELTAGKARHVVAMPFLGRTQWRVSADGARIVIVSPLTAVADSGALRVTMLNENGDTVFARTHRVASRRISDARANSLVAGYQAFGSYSAKWIRDTVRALIPPFEFRVVNVLIGRDHSTWIWLRGDAGERPAIVLDSLGNVAGTASVPLSARTAVYSLDRVWSMEPAGPGQGATIQFNIVRSARVQPPAATRVRSARPPRSAPTSASSSPAPPPA